MGVFSLYKRRLNTILVKLHYNCSICISNSYFVLIFVICVSKASFDHMMSSPQCVFFFNSSFHSFSVSSASHLQPRHASGRRSQALLALLSNWPIGCSGGDYHALPLRSPFPALHHHHLNLPAQVRQTHSWWLMSKDTRPCPKWMCFFRQWLARGDGLRHYNLHKWTDCCPLITKNKKTENQFFSDVCVCVYFMCLHVSS